MYEIFELIFFCFIMDCIFIIVLLLFCFVFILFGEILDLVIFGIYIGLGFLFLM